MSRNDITHLNRLTRARPPHSLPRDGMNRKIPILLFFASVMLLSTAGHIPKELLEDLEQNRQELRNVEKAVFAYIDDHDLPEEKRRQWRQIQLNANQAWRTALEAQLKTMECQWYGGSGMMAARSWHENEMIKERIRRLQQMFELQGEEK